MVESMVTDPGVLGGSGPRFKNEVGFGSSFQNMVGSGFFFRETDPVFFGYWISTGSGSGSSRCQIRIRVKPTRISEHGLKNWYIPSKPPTMPHKSMHIRYSGIYIVVLI